MDNNYGNGNDVQNYDYQNNAGGYQNPNQNPYAMPQYQDEKKTKAQKQGNRVKFLFFILICAIVFTVFWLMDFDLFEDLPIFQYLSYASWVFFGIDLLYVIFRRLFG